MEKLVQEKKRAQQMYQTNLDRVYKSMEDNIKRMDGLEKHQKETDKKIEELQSMFDDMRTNRSSSPPPSDYQGSLGRGSSLSGNTTFVPKRLYIRGWSPQGEPNYIDDKKAIKVGEQAIRALPHKIQSEFYVERTRRNDPNTNAPQNFQVALGFIGTDIDHLDVARNFISTYFAKEDCMVNGKKIYIAKESSPLRRKQYAAYCRAWEWIMEQKIFDKETTQAKFAARNYKLQIQWVETGTMLGNVPTEGFEFVWDREEWGKVGLDLKFLEGFGSAADA